MFEVVSLTHAEAYYAECIGMTRYYESRRRGLEDLSKSDEQYRIAEDVLGAQAELAFCKWRGCEWPAHVNVGHTIPDVPPFFEIRSSAIAHYSLIVRTNDAPERLYVLLTGSPERFTIKGWMGGGGARQDRWWKNPKNLGWAWFVPQSELFDPGCLQ